ncbi:MAG: helix-turn-helix domain-containing protein [Planctomycetaceae bacterium]
MSTDLEKSIATLEQCRLTDINLKSLIGPEYEFEFSGYLVQWLDREGLVSVNDKKEGELYWAWKIAQAAFANNTEFRALFRAARACWDLIDSAGNQQLLGRRAGLEIASVGARPSSGVQCQPLLPPNDPPFAFNQYCRHFGGPHRMGAILLWWCAAAMTPTEFGFASGFSGELIRQPFWFEVGHDLCVADQRPVQLMVESATFIVNRSAQRNTAEEDETLENSPFYAIVKVFEKFPELSATQMKVLDYCCKQHLKNRPIQVEHLMSAVWGEDPPQKKSLSSTITRLTKKLEDQNLDVEIGTAGPLVRFEIISDAS